MSAAAKPKFTRTNPCVAMPISLRTSGLLAQLTCAQLKVWLALATRIDGAHECWPSHGRIAEDTGLTKRAVIEAIKGLAEIGLLEMEHRNGSDGGSRSNLYTLMYPAYEPESVNPASPPGESSFTPPSESEFTPPGESSFTLTNNQLEHVPTEHIPATPDSAAAPSADEPVSEKADPYQQAIEIYQLAGRPEPPRSEVLPLLRGIKAALGSPGWDVARVAAAWRNALGSGGNPAVWSLAYTLRHLTEAEAMVPRQPGASTARSAQPAAYLRSDRAWAEEVAREWAENGRANE